MACASALTCNSTLFWLSTSLLLLIAGRVSPGLGEAILMALFFTITGEVSLKEAPASPWASAQQ